MNGRAKNWDQHVAHAEDVARMPSFAGLRDRVLDLAALEPGDTLVDVGAGTGLLSLAAAERVKRVWAIDIAPLMCEYLRTKAASAGLDNVSVGVAPATSLPLVDAFADVVVSNYCLHHVGDADKHRALAEARRVLRPGGRLVIGDMMFRIGGVCARDRRIAVDMSRHMLSRGMPGALRLTRNALRIATGRGEHPAGPEWWRRALYDAGFADVYVEALAHKSGIAAGRLAP